MEVKIFKCDKSKNLCDSCVKCFANCEVDNGVIEFGNGLGGDNVIQCDQYTPKEILPQGVNEDTIDL